MTRICIVKIFGTVVRLSEVLAHTKKLLVWYVTNVFMQAFVEGLLRLANVLEATNGTLKNVNNTCTLAINTTKYVVLFSDDFTGIRWRVLHMSTTFTGFSYCLIVWKQPLEAQERCCTVWNLFRQIPNAHEWCWSCFVDSAGMWGNTGFFYISVFLCTEINCPWNCSELCLNFSSYYFVYIPFFSNDF